MGHVYNPSRAVLLALLELVWTMLAALGL